MVFSDATHKRGLVERDKRGHYTLFPLSEQTLVARTYNDLTHILVFESQRLPVGPNPLPTLLSLNLTKNYDKKKKSVTEGKNTK